MFLNPEIVHFLEITIFRLAKKHINLKFYYQTKIRAVVLILLEI
jgi:hypothetical protein